MTDDGATFSRRAFLAGCTVAALPATRRDPPTVRWVGETMSRAHRVLSGAFPTTSFEKDDKARVVIVGAGPSGLAAAWRLLEAGVDDVVVLELGEEPWGLLGRFRCGDAGLLPFGATEVDLGGSSTGVLRRLAASSAASRPADASAALPRVVAMRRGDGRLVASGADANRDSFIDRWIATDESAPDARASAVAAGATPETLRWLDFEVRRRFASKLADLDATPVKALLDAMRRRPEAFVAPVGGPGVWFESVVTRLGERLRPRQVVGLVGSESDGVSVYALDAARGLTTRLRASSVVLAVPAIVAMRLSAAASASRPSLHAPESVTRFVAAVGVRRLPIGAEAPGTRIDAGDDDGTYATVHPTGDGGGFLIVRTAFPYRATGPSRAFLTALDYDTGRDLALERLRRVVGGDVIPTRFDLWRVGHAGVRPGFGGGRGWVERTPMRKGVVLAGSDASGAPGFDTAVVSGVRGAQEAIGVVAGSKEDWLA